MARAEDADKYVDEDGVTRYRRAPGSRNAPSPRGRVLTDEQIDGETEISEEDLSRTLGNLSVRNILKDKTSGYKKRHGFGRARQLDVMLRRAKALELRRAGFTWQEIADRKSLGYNSARNAQRDVHRLLQQMIDTPAREVLALELSRLDAITQALWQQVRAGDLPSIDRIFTAMRMRDDLLGLNQINITHSVVTVNDLDREIANLTKEIAAMDTTSVGGTESSISDPDELEAARKAAGL